MALPGDEAVNFITNLVSQGQIQPAGVDLSLRKVFKLKSHLTLGRERRSLPEFEEVEPGSDGWWYLSQGVYKVMFNEVVSVPEDYVALCFPRSTLLRSGVLLVCTVWDPGYVGRGEALLHVMNPYGLKIERCTPVAQLVFVKLLKKPSRTYKGIYRGENLDK